jgi:hypothetical protein
MDHYAFWNTRFGMELKPGFQARQKLDNSKEHWTSTMKDGDVSDEFS